jgi:hypothetical protein
MEGVRQPAIGRLRSNNHSAGEGLCHGDHDLQCHGSPAGSGVGTARSLLPKSAGLRSPAWVSLAVAQFPRARRRAFLRAELQSDSIVVSRRAAQLIHSVSRKRERQAGVAVHG